MADGRMLKKVISTSPRLASLKTDTNRLIYTWLIPHLDIEGRIQADPRILKSIFPLLDHITPAVIDAALADMAANELIVLYMVGHCKYLQLERFHKHQNLRKDREKQSDIPPPDEAHKISPGVLPEESRITPPQDKLSKDKISKDNSAAGVKPPVDNLQGDEIKTALQEIHNKKGPRYAQQCLIFIQSNFRNGNQKAIVKCLNQVIKGIDQIEHPKAYLEAAFKIENGKQNAMDHDNKAQEFKKPITRGEMTTMGEILKGIGKGGP